MQKLETSVTDHGSLLSNIASFGRKLKAAKGTNNAYKLSSKLSSLEPPPLTPRQNEKLQALRHRLYVVKDREGNKLFQVTIQQIIDQIENLMKRIPGAELEDVELIGSGAANILEGDRDYNISVQLLLSPDTQPLEINHDPVAPNDLDIRFKLKGCSVEDRKWLSKKLIEFYTSLAKEQSAELLALKVASAVHEKERPALIENMKKLVFAIKKNLPVPGLDPRGYEEIRRFVRVSPKEPGKEDQEDQLIAEKYINAIAPDIIKNRASLIAKHFKLPCELSAYEGNMIEKTSQFIVRKAIFDKLCHVDEPKSGNAFSIQSFANLEAILVQEINSHLLSVDANRISLRTLKVKGGIQGLLDRMMRIVRIDHQLLSAMHFLKYHSYKIHGIEPASQSTENVLAWVAEWCLGSDPARFEKILNAYFDNHIKGDPLKLACLMFSCCLSIKKHCSEETKNKFLNVFKRGQELQNAGGWANVIHAMIISEDVPLEDAECLIQGLSALYLRKKMKDRPDLSIAVREDLSPKTIRIKLQGPSSAHHYLNVVLGAKDVLEKCCDLIETSIPHQRLFSMLYAHILGDQDKPKLQLIELLKEVGNWHKTRSLWDKVAKNIQDQDLKNRVCQAAAFAGVFDNAIVDEESIWDIAPVDEVKRKVVNLFVSGKEGPAWILALATMRKRGDPARPVVEALSDAALKSNYGVAWNLSQIYEFLKFYSKDLGWCISWLIKCVQKAVSAAAVNPDVKPAAYIWLERLMKKKALELANPSDAYRIVLSFVTNVDDDSTLPYPDSLLQAFHDNAGYLLSIAGSDENRFKLLERLRIRNFEVAVNDESLYCIIAGYGSSLAAGYANPAHRQALQNAIHNLPKFISPEKGLDERWESLLNTFFDQLLKNRQFALLDSFMKFASLFSALSNSYNAKLMREMHVFLDSENPAEKLEEIMQLRRYCTDVTLEIWIKLFKAAAPSKDAHLKNELWVLWEKHAYDPQHYPGQEAKWMSTWCAAMPFLKENRQKNRLIGFLEHIDIVENILRTPEGQRQIEPILAEVRKLNSDKASRFVPAIRRIRSHIPAESEEQPSEEIVKFDLWLANICLSDFSTMPEGLGILERLHCSKAAESCRPELGRLYNIALIDTAHSNVTQEILDTLEGLLPLMPKECPALIDDLWGSRHRLHARVIKEQFACIWKNPDLSRDVSVKVMNTALLEFLDDPRTLDLAGVQEVFKRYPFRENEEMKASAVKYFHVHLEHNEGKMTGEFIGELLFIQPSIRVDPLFYAKSLSVLESMLPGEPRSFFDTVDNYFKFLKKTHNDGIVILQNPDLYQHILSKDKKDWLRLDIYIGKNGLPKGLKPLGTFAYDIFHMIVRHFESFKEREERAILLDMAYSCMQTAVTSKNYNRAEIIKLIEQYVYLCPFDDILLLEHHLHKKTIEYIQYIQGQMHVFDDNIPIMHELLLFSCWEKSTDRVSSKDNSSLDVSVRLQIVKDLMARLQKSGKSEQIVHACHIAKAALNSFLKHDNEAFLEVYSLAIPLFLHTPITTNFNRTVIKFMLEDIYWHIKEMKWKNPDEYRLYLRKIFFIHMPVEKKISEMNVNADAMPGVAFALEKIAWTALDVFEHFSSEYVAFLTEWLPIICSKITSRPNVTADTWFNLLKEVFVKKDLVKDSEDASRQKSLQQSLIRKLVEANHEKTREVVKLLAMHITQTNQGSQMTR